MEEQQIHTEPGVVDSQPFLPSQKSEIVAILSETGLSIVKSGISDLQFVLAAAPCCE